MSTAAQSCPTDLDSGDVESDVASTESNTGYDMDFDDYSAESLEEGAVAATSYDFEPEDLEKIDPETIDDLEYDDGELEQYDGFTVLGGDLYGVKGEIEFIANEDVYGCLDDEILDHVNGHEGRHAKQFRDEWGEAEKEYQNISDELAEELDYVNEHGSLELLEGLTEFVTEASYEEGREIGEPFYPEETEMARRYLEMRGFDLEEEFKDYDEENIRNEFELYEEIEASAQAAQEAFETDMNAFLKESGNAGPV